MPQQKLPIVWYGKAIGTATIEDGGEIHGEIDGDLLNPEERRRIMGSFPTVSIAVVDGEVD